jgi:hypothetical protein
MGLTSLREGRRRLGRLQRRETIPLADAPSFEGASRRARRVRVALGAVLIAGGVAAFLVAPTQPGRRFLPSTTAGIVVLDVSSSIQPGTYYRIEHVLASLAATRERLGLVLFSDVAYEALPPGTPAAELKPLLRFFAPPGSAGKDAIPSAGAIPEGPWQQWFSAGTVVSNGLFLADNLLQHNIKHGSIVLISDLADDPTDDTQLANAVHLVQQQHIPLEIVGLNPKQQDVEFFKGLLGPKALLQTASLPTSAEASGKLALVSGFPQWLAALSCLIIVLLAVNEWWAEPFRWRPRSST